MDETFEQKVEKHWAPDAPGSILRRIDEALIALGKDPEAITLADLAQVDEFHIRGRAATQELAALAKVSSRVRVIDIGSGIGGPSRTLAAAHGCSVTGFDLSGEYCAIATALAQRVGLQDKVSYHQANALALPVDDGSFDLAWTQHISMNIEDKAAFFAEIYRVLRPGGRTAIYDPIAGGKGPIEFPVPWARDPSMSFLIKAQDTRTAIEKAGFTVEIWRDMSDVAIAWFRDNAAKAAQGGATTQPSPLNLQLLVGSDWPTMAKNMVSNLVEGRLAVVQVIARKL